MAHHDSAHDDVRKDFQMEKFTLKISDMTCDGCAAKVRRSLENIEGVCDVEVSLEKGEAVVTCDDTFANPDTLANAVDAAGFDVVQEY